MFLLPSLSHAQDSSNTVVARLSRGQQVHLTEVSVEDRPRAILAIKKFLKDNPTCQNRFWEIEMLVALGDDETIRDLVNKYNHSFDSPESDALSPESDALSPESDALSYGANPEIIPFLAPDLSLPKDAGFRSLGDVGVLTPRLWSVSTILLCIAKSSEFPAKTQAWARSRHGNWDNTWSAVDQWWTHNKDAVLAKRYSEATWLPPQK